MLILVVLGVYPRKAIPDLLDVGFDFPDHHAADLTAVTIGTGVKNNHVFAKDNIRQRLAGFLTKRLALLWRINVCQSNTDFLFFRCKDIYGVAVQDRDLFQRLLKNVLESPSGALPEARLTDEAAKRKAAALMEKIDDYF